MMVIDLNWVLALAGRPQESVCEPWAAALALHVTQSSLLPDFLNVATVHTAAKIQQMRQSSWSFRHTHTHWNVQSWSISYNTFWWAWLISLSHEPEPSNIPRFRIAEGFVGHWENIWQMKVQMLGCDSMSQTWWCRTMSMPEMQWRKTSSIDIIICIYIYCIYYKYAFAHYSMSTETQSETCS